MDKKAQAHYMVALGLLNLDREHAGNGTVLRERVRKKRELEARVRTAFLAYAYNRGEGGVRLYDGIVSSNGAINFLERPVGEGISIRFTPTTDPFLSRISEGSLDKIRTYVEKVENVKTGLSFGRKRELRRELNLLGSLDRVPVSLLGALSSKEHVYAIGELVREVLVSSHGRELIITQDVGIPLPIKAS